MTELEKEIEEELPPALEEIVSRFERLSLTLTTRPPFVVSEQPTDTEQDLKD